ncbi:MAG: DUF86 domain-containing protein [Pseudomonadota bacterium]
MDRSLIAEKLESLRRCLARIQQRCPDKAEILADDLDAQDIVSLNLTRAVQISVDIAAHLLAGTQQAAPETMAAAFDRLAAAGVIPGDLATRLKKSVGFRNLAVHNYNAIDWNIVFSICQYHLDDFREFATLIHHRLDA